MKDYQFKLTNVALYSKNWYGRTNDIWSDLILLLTEDGYLPSDKWDVVGIIQTQIQRFILQENSDYRLTTFLEGINPHECWKVGYHLKDHKDYDYYEAVIRSSLSLISHSDRKELGWGEGYIPTIANILPKKKD